MYADVNGMKMFYEIRGSSDPGQVPLVLLHGAISATGPHSGRCRTCYTDMNGTAECPGSGMIDAR